MSSMRKYRKGDKEAKLFIPNKTSLFKAVKTTLWYVVYDRFCKL